MSLPKLYFFIMLPARQKDFNKSQRLKKKKRQPFLSHFKYNRTLPISPSNKISQKKKKGSPPNSLPHVKGIVQSLNRVRLFATPWSAACSEGNRREIILQTDNCNFKSHDHILPQAVNQSVNNSNQNECSNKCFRLSSFRMINSFEITFS